MHFIKANELDIRRQWPVAGKICIYGETDSFGGGLTPSTQGLLYEGVSDRPVQLYGETGAQSSIVPAFDAALGIEHQEDWSVGNHILGGGFE